MAKGGRCRGCYLVNGGEGIFGTSYTFDCGSIITISAKVVVDFATYLALV
jgi:hypothetical protein